MPILYFGNLEAYENSPLKVLTVGKNPSDNEFRLKKGDPYSFSRFTKWDKNKLNLIESLNPYFEEKPLKQWFSSFEPILNGLNCSYYCNNFENRALHTDICSPLATNPTWSRMKPEDQNKLYANGVVIWKDLIEELQPDILLVSLPIELFKKSISSHREKLITFEHKKDGSKRKKDYIVYVHNYILKSGKETKVIFGQAANKPFDTISKYQKEQIGMIICPK